jgi:hypothetical protein
MHYQQGGDMCTNSYETGGKYLLASKGGNAFVQGELAFMQGKLIVSPES